MSNAVPRRAAHVVRSPVFTRCGLCLANMPVCSLHKLVDAKVDEEMAREDRAALISRHGAAKTDVLCTKALDIFVSAYGSEAGNLALKTLPFGFVCLWRVNMWRGREYSASDMRCVCTVLLPLTCALH